METVHNSQTPLQQPPNQKRHGLHVECYVSIYTAWKVVFET